jgi:hypothetical protein
MEGPFSFWKIFDQFCVPAKVQTQPVYSQTRNPSDFAMIKYDPNSAKDDSFCAKLLKLGSCQNLCPVAKIESGSTTAGYSSNKATPAEYSSGTKHKFSELTTSIINSSLFPVQEMSDLNQMKSISGVRQKDGTTDKHAAAHKGRHPRKRSLPGENEIEHTLRATRTHSSTDHHHKNHGTLPRKKAEVL